MVKKLIELVRNALFRRCIMPGLKGLKVMLRQKLKTLKHGRKVFYRMTKSIVMREEPKTMTTFSLHTYYCIGRLGGVVKRGLFTARLTARGEEPPRP